MTASLLMRRLRQLLDVAKQLSRPLEVQPAGCKSGRGFSVRPGRVDEYSTYYRKPDTISTRAQAQQTAEAAESAPAEASTSAAEQSTTAADATDDMRRAGAQSGKHLHWIEEHLAACTEDTLSHILCSQCLDVPVGKASDGWQRPSAHLGAYILGRLCDGLVSLPLL